MTPREELDIDRLSALRARLAEPGLAGTSQEVNAEVFGCFFADRVYVENSRFLYVEKGLMLIDGDLVSAEWGPREIPRYTTSFDDAIVLKGGLLPGALSLTEIEDDFLPIWEANMHDRDKTRVIGTGRSTECATAILLSVLDSMISDTPR